MVYGDDNSNIISNYYNVVKKKKINHFTIAILRKVI